uniref:Putative transcriptional regulatory protein n=1 Tax=Talaromyces marneffei PM1 TaxID=1077442 RepID=A0A093VB51_TALMA
MPDSSRESFQSIAELRGLSSIEQPIPDKTTAAATIASFLPGQKTLTPTSGPGATEVSGGAGEKVWIPRVSHRPGLLLRARTKHACEACRRRRIKCDGARPYEHLLRDLLHEVPASAAKRIKTTLTPSDSYALKHNPSMSSSSSSSAGSVEGIDTISEDLNRNEESRATGFMGKNSVHAWLRNLEPDSGHRVSPDRNMETAGRTQFGQPISPQGLDNNMAVSYFLDDQKLPPSNSVDAYKLPPKNLADWILHSYFKSVHSLFPIVRTDLFLEQYKSIWGVSGSPRPGQKWLAIFNMILAIGCRRLQFLQERLPTGVSHDLFFSRARCLCVNENMIFEHADLQQVQVEALVTLYFMVSMQINRAWKVSGIAVRSAMALAINLRITDTDLQPGSKEARSRLWWSIYMLENVLSHMTGRPTCIGSLSFSVDQPIPYSEDMFAQPQVMDLLTNETLRKERLKWSLDEQENDKDDYDPFWLKDIETNQGLQFYHLVDLMHIVHITIGELFSPKGFQASRSYIKRRIRFYDERLDHWLSRLHPALRFVDQNCNLNMDSSSQEKTVLAMHYYGARITLYRPCSPFRRYVGLKEKEYAYISQRCLQAALSLIAVFPEVTDLDWVYNIAPWWCMLHFLMQASTILVIFIQSSEPTGSAHMKDVEYSFAAPGVATQVQAACQKAHRWLHGFSRVDESCRRAFLLYDDLLQRLGFAMSSSVTSLSESAQSNPLSRNQSEGANAQHVPDQPAYNVQSHDEYPSQMALDPSMERYNHPMHDAGDALSSLDWRNIDPSVDALFAELVYMEDVFGGSEWIGSAFNDKNF